MMALDQICAELTSCGAKFVQLFCMQLYLVSDTMFFHDAVACICVFRRTEEEMSYRDVCVAFKRADLTNLYTIITIIKE